jgi:hypothetical protein
MKSKVTRRNVLGALGGVAGIATASCGSANTAAPEQKATGTMPMASPAATLVDQRVNLICHGMMLFLWKDTDADRNFITILLPTPPTVDGKPTGRELHKISLGGFAGIRNVLPQPPFPQGTSTPLKYELKITSTSGFTRKLSAFQGGPRAGESVVLKDMDTKLGLQQKFTERYSIRVPYPTNVRPFRSMDFGGSPPFAGQAVKDLGISPRYMTGVNVLTFDGVDADVVLTNLADSSTTTIGPPTMNIHLYSQPEDLADVHLGDHIGQFNKLVYYHPTAGATATPLDLMVANEYPDYPVEGTPSDISALDLASLFELSGNAKANPDKARSNKKTGGMGRLSVEPVECLQGWGT